MNGSPRHFNTIGFCLVCLLSLTGNTFAQTTIASLQPASCQPGVTTKLTLRGSKLPSNLRVLTNRADAKVEMECVTADSLIVAVTMPSDARLGPLGLWFATPSGPLPSKIVLVDDLPTVLDNGNNHSVATAQPVSTLGAIDGVSQGLQFDYYRFTTTAGQRVAFEIHTQSIHSKMDPIVRLLHADGRVMHIEDDDSTGPDCRFSFSFAEAGEYFLQIGESHYAVGGEYHLRIGDFPIVHHVFPFAARRGESAKFTFSGPDSSLVGGLEVAVPSGLADDFLLVPARIPGGLSSAWGTLVVSKSPQFVEPVRPSAPGELPRSVVDSPICISGQLELSGERDSYWIRGKIGRAHV